MARTAALEAVERLYTEGFPDPATATVDELRIAYDDLLLRSAAPGAVSARAGEIGGVPVLYVAADGASEKTQLVWFHGGGYVLGSARGFQGFGLTLSRSSGMTVILPDYRRAPENKFPAAVDDAVSVISALVAEYGCNNVTVGGDSAGGGLALAALAVLRDRGSDLPVAAALISPLLDFTASGESADRFDGVDVAVSRGSIANLSAAYLQGHDPADPLASPIFGDLSGLPPTLFLVGSQEVLLDDSRRAVAAITASGGTAALSVYDDMVHVWPLFSALLPEGLQAAEELGAFLQAPSGI